MDDWDAELSQVVAPPNPAAGAEFTYNFPGSEASRVRSVCFTLTNDATVASRTVYLDVIDGSGNLLASFSPNYTQAASLTTVYTFGIDLNVFGANDAGRMGCPFVSMILRRGQSIKTTINNLQATDAITDIRLVVDQIPVKPERATSE